jgi:hypothetical protein
VLQGKPSRRLWIAALVVSAICIGGLAYGLVTEWNTPPTRTLDSSRAPASGTGFGLGVGIGIGVGVVLASLLAARKRD